MQLRIRPCKSRKKQGIKKCKCRKEYFKNAYKIKSGYDTYRCSFKMLQMWWRTWVKGLFAQCFVSIFLVRRAPSIHFCLLPGDVGREGDAEGAGGATRDVPEGAGHRWQIGFRQKK